MHNYGAYIWPAYLLLMIVFGWNIIQSFRQKLKTMKRVRNNYASSS